MRQIVLLHPHPDADQEQPQARRSRNARNSGWIGRLDVPGPVSSRENLDFMNG